MPILHTIDGREIQSNYNQAAKIMEIKTGKRKPDDNRQEAFAATIDHITFEPIRTNKPIRCNVYGHDQELRKIISNTNLKGINKARAIAERLRTR